MTDEIWTIKAALEWTQGYLARKGDENPRLSAEWLLAEATGLRRVELYVNFERPLSMEERDILRGYVSRRGAGEPLQYITGEVAFRHIAVKVRPGVLIPRPETEVLVSEALSLLPPAGRRVARDSQIGAWEGDLLRAAEAAVGESGDGSDAFSQVASALEEAGGFSSEGAEASGDSGAETLFVADLCTGSGCIACSIAYERPDARVIATDISPDAVALAGENAGALGLPTACASSNATLRRAFPRRQSASFTWLFPTRLTFPPPLWQKFPRRLRPSSPRLPSKGALMGSMCSAARSNGAGRRCVPAAAARSSCTRPALTKRHRLRARRASSMCASSPTSLAGHAFSRRESRSASTSRNASFGGRSLCGRIALFDYVYYGEERTCLLITCSKRTSKKRLASCGSASVIASPRSASCSARASALWLSKSRMPSSSRSARFPI